MLTSYVYDREDIVLEFDGLGAMVAHYTHGQGTDFPLEMERGGQTYYYHYDGLGSVTELTDSSGAVAQAYLYNAFGTIVQNTSSLVNPFTYTAREFDPESNLYFYRTRYYDGNIGRFISEDRKGLEESLNLYSYAGNTPVNGNDPFGFYGTNSCDYYLKKCEGGYCYLAWVICQILPISDDPDPTRDDDYEGFPRCTRQCLQNCDAKGIPLEARIPNPNRNQGSCFPPPPMAMSKKRISNPIICHDACISICISGKNPGF